MKIFGTILISLTLFAILLTGCEAETGDASGSSGSAVPQQASSGSAVPQQVSSGSTVSQQASSVSPAPSQPRKQTFKPGTWLASGNEGNTYYFFDADGSSGRTLRQTDGMGLPFSYQGKGDEVTFYMGSPDTPVPASVVTADEDHLSLRWKDGRTEELTYVSNATSDTFRFYSDNELCDMALKYCRAHAEKTDDLSNLTAAAAANQDGTVAIQIYRNLGDHNSTYAWYTVDRQSAKGTDSNTGKTVDLAA